MASASYSAFCPFFSSLMLFKSPPFRRLGLRMRQVIVRLNKLSSNSTKHITVARDLQARLIAEIMIVRGPISC